jgi:hypothetical protein
MATRATPLVHTENVDGSQSFRGNVRFRGKVALGGAITDLASAAALAIPDDGIVFNVTGTTGITSLTGGWAGRIIVLKFASTAQVSDGNNLKLSAAGPNTADDTLTLVCDGTNWYEIARSVN